jgi:hypothetical protein
MRIRCVGLACSVLALALVASGGAATTSSFTPSTLAGNWTGTWTNQTFGSTGPATMTVLEVKVKPKKVTVLVKVKGHKKKRKKIKLVPQPSKLRFGADWGGNVFGCADPAPDTATITKGTGPNHWNAAGFEVQGSTGAFGTLDLVYSQAAATLTGGGGDPPCAAGLKWTLEGTFPDSTHFQGTVHITLPSGMPATSILSLSR